MSHEKLIPFIVKVSVLGYFPLYNLYVRCCNSGIDTAIKSMSSANRYKYYILLQLWLNSTT